MYLSRLPPGDPEIFASIQGEGITAGLPSVFVRLSRCNLKCTWCFVPDTPVLLADWTWTPIGRLVPGDEVIALGQPSRLGAHARLTVATVTRTHARQAATVIVNSTVRCTPDHKFWMTGRDREGRSIMRAGWREVSRSGGGRALFASEVNEVDAPVYERGWLAGMADGDGCFWTLAFRRGYRRFRLALNDNALLEQALRFAANAGYILRPGRHEHVGFKGRSTMQALWLTSDGEVRRWESWLGADVDHPSWHAGYLGGIIDAEGSLSHGILRISQDIRHQRVRGRIERSLRSLRFGYTLESKGYYVSRARGELQRLMSLSRPRKDSVRRNVLTHRPRGSRVIEDLSIAPRSEVVNLTTSAGSFVAGGYVVKNCDTRYTWDWSQYDPAVESILSSPDEIVETVAREARGTISNVVLTGGEPLLQRRALSDLAVRLHDAGFRIEVETNGTIVPDDVLAAVVDQWNVSPKLASSGNEAKAREVPAALTWFSARSNAWFKFVAVGAADVSDIAELVRRYRVDPGRVIVSPEATDAETLAERSRALVEACLERGFRLGGRMHVALWGAERGR